MHLKFYFLQRKIILPHRYADDQAKRTQPPPNIPDGPNQKTSQIYYYTRDARREVKPPMLIDRTKQIDTEKESVAEKKFLTPGKAYNWGS
ncbi:NADH dehydrogenase [ubiquinone] 1 alpha subcomplex subunit 7 [Trachymyrmex zeteki]|uniref:NADH dehydrogenase [ubiquinone] 1 alpha subcomplex subunit 7 n=1 Tax=Mycetomoellerius zeteki TaxID=64791 RepID=A0A151XA93_9HYME|nr:NADH dehydrogenase [ubiquinone] 1 alpha subcomplex subunit 7 [Trachymyrmex zeteki]